MMGSGSLVGVLRGVVRGLVADLQARVDGEEPVREPLVREYEAAFAAERTGWSFTEWVEDRLTQVAVGWVLACVFVRFCEDNGLIVDAMIAGEGPRGIEARAAQQDFFRAHPHGSDRDYFHEVFRRAARFAGLGGVLDEGRSALWLVDPSADACSELLTTFRATTDDGALALSFRDPLLDTRFLGDLYQDLSDHAKKTYALLQTPVFVEEFILDRTLEPALETHGLANTTLIDPTCGSGHFLLGAFSRLVARYADTFAGDPPAVNAQRALDAVWGVDLNPFAAAIARFRLLVAALQHCGLTRLIDTPDFTIHVAVGDSLLWGTTGAQLSGMDASLFGGNDNFVYATEDADALRATFTRHYAAVVGNPPYIVPNDPAANAAYRRLYTSCHRQYSLGVPFTELFITLANPADPTTGRPAGHVGLITANSFMKREFGKKLIEHHIPQWDLTHVIDTSGAYIPGHGTPTVILLARHQHPITPTIRTAMGIRGEPSTPTDPTKGLVWTAITQQIDQPDTTSTYISVADTPRERFHHHPWSIGGGGAAELKQQLDSSASVVLQSAILEVGTGAVTREDEAFRIGRAAHRIGCSDSFIRSLVAGEDLRDWSYASLTDALWPYDRGSLDGASDLALQSFLWRWRTQLAERVAFGKTQMQRGLKWWEYSMFFKQRFRTPLSIAFAFVATHNHFVLDRGGKVFKQSAPVIKLPADATLDDHYGLLALLNSSIACFWMKQVFHNKGGGGSAGKLAADSWENFHEFDGTKLQQFPLPVGARPVAFGERLDQLATQHGESLPAAVAERAVPTRAVLDTARTHADAVFAQMVTYQEELDWHCLHLYGLTDTALTVPQGAEPPPLALGERAFEIVLARQLAAGDTDTAWFTRHRSTPITELPTHWPHWYRDLVERRIEAIETDHNIGLIERPEHKRRWNQPAWEDLEHTALRDWLLDHLEHPTYWFDNDRPTVRSLAQLADRAATDPDWMTVARTWTGQSDIDPLTTVTTLVADEHVPAQAAARYKPTGLAKHAEWHTVWNLQRREDAGESVGRIPVPPKYGQGDFQKTSYWRHRGKLDVPKERFISITDAERDPTTGDTTPIFAWAGFDHAQQAQAIATLLYQRQTNDNWNDTRITPIAVALAETLPWLQQWHPDTDPTIGQPLHTFYQALINQTLTTTNQTPTTLTTWTPTPTTRTRTRKATA